MQHKAEHIDIYRILAVQDEVFLFGDSLCTFSIFSCISVTTGYWISGYWMVMRGLCLRF